MADNTILAPALEPVAKNEVTFPNDSKEFRLARNVRLAEEIGLRRHIEKVASCRCAE